ncbi:copper amine oxidase N-terminal domain-containing protein [Paenibacillus sp. MAH-36]|uniref:Copper amine oxidase N-terminal domain-containing protein n=3 Tax=Paenibacillus TaxID=44249 RepID=A0ABU3RKH3_9BACL|nr:copper amine oxidase N-terminal domain-containing protein [Paenibacillus sp. PFR10]MDU0204799.1 copper amine oxidase N-terminal domain-containing protein [Paenibacillus sp. PFR10]
MKKMLKRIGAASVMTAMLAGGASAISAADTDIALRSAMESMNGTLGWAYDTQMIIVDVAGSKASLKVGSTDATIKGQAVKLDKAPYVMNGATQISPATLKQIQDALKGSDKLLFTFSSVGDCRIEDGYPGASAQDLKWMVNTKVLTRMTDEMEAKKSNMLLFNGDMILGYSKNSDVNYLNRQYAYWRGVVGTAFEHGMYVFPVPGNHEMQDKYKDDNGKTVKKATESNENTWRDNMGDIIVDSQRFSQILGDNIAGFDPNNFPQIGDVDKISTNQKQLDYSFDYRGSHFAIINTDPTGNDSHAPTEWLAKDLAAAKARGMKHNFVFGHKMAYTYIYDPSITEPGGLDADKSAADAFWKVIEDNKATYLSGHEHITDISRPNNGSAYQIIVGSGGSPFEAVKPTGKDTDRYYSYVTAKVYESGKVHFDAYGFDANFGPTQNYMSWDLEQGF